MLKCWEGRRLGNNLGQGLLPMQPRGIRTVETEVNGRSVGDRELDVRPCPI
jgi:hypothetical protein